MMGGLVEQEETVVEAPAHVIPPSRHDQATAARGAKLWTWIARITGLALLAAVLGFGFYLAAANAYRASVGGCKGADGTPGANGTNGTNGQPGAPGESVVGPQCPAGANGLDGANGVGVTGVSCVLQDDLSTAFRFTFSDASFVDVAGPCLP